MNVLRNEKTDGKIRCATIFQFLGWEMNKGMEKLGLIKLINKVDKIK